MKLFLSSVMGERIQMFSMRPTCLQNVGNCGDVTQTVDCEKENDISSEKSYSKMHSLKFKDEAIVQALKQTTSDNMGQNCMDAEKFESPLSPHGLDIGSQKITTCLEPESQGQSSGKVVMAVKPSSKHVRVLSLDENDLHRKCHSSLPDNSLGSRATTLSPRSGITPRMTQKQNPDVDYSFERSLASPYQGKVGGKRGLPTSPFWERKVSSSTTQGFGFATPGRRTPKPITSEVESPDNTPAVPKFGDWDESDPSAADRFTQVFDQVREQKQNGGGTRTATINGPSSQNRKGKFGNSSEGCCCFPWGKH